MFRLSQYVQKEIKQQPLYEAYTYFNALSNEVKDYILFNKNYIQNDNSLSQNSKVTIMPYSDVAEITQMLFGGKILFLILRYGAEDLWISFQSSFWRKTVQTKKLSDMKDIMNDYEGTFNYPDSPQSASAYVKFCNNIALFLSKALNKPKKNIIARMSFQAVMADDERTIQHQNRIIQKRADSTITKNGITTPSNDNLNSYYSLQKRLKAYIESKVKNITNPKDLPTDLGQLLSKKFQFKLLGSVYVLYSSDRIDIRDLLNGSTFKISFIQDKYNNHDFSETLTPNYILFFFHYVNGKFELKSIKATSDSYINNENKLPSLSLFLARRQMRINQEKLYSPDMQDYQKPGTEEFDNELEIKE